jgi:preprotein translocase SecE subunit
LARNRQRAKERQAARRAERERQGKQGDGAPGAEGAPKQRPRDERAGDVDPIMGGAPGVVGDDIDEDELLRQAEIEAGTPPHDLGFSDETLQHSPLKEGDPEDLEELDEDLEDYDFEDEEQPLDEAATRGPRGVRGGRAGAEDRHRNRLVAFLIAVWAELQRVQWPNRKQLTQMTGVVLVFVLIAGGYLGLLDAIFSRLIQQII